MGNTIIGTDRGDNLATREVGDTLMGLGGDDVLSNSGSDAVLVGGAGNDLYRLYQPGATILEDADGGHDTVWAWRSVVMADNVEDLVFKGTFNFQSIRGNTLDNSIVAGAGTQAIDGGGGNDTLTGGGDADTFNFEPGDGHDVIVDFRHGEDKIAIWHPEFRTFADVLARAENVGGDVRIDVEPGQTITLQNVALESLDAADFGLERSIDDVVATGVLTFEDNFDDASSLAGGRWNTTPTDGHPAIRNSYSGRSDHEQAYLDANSTLPDGTPVGIDPFSVADGKLSITARRLPGELADALGTEWSSGMLETHGTFEQTYGYYEVRAKMPEGKGFWPAFWLMSADYAWPPEIDVVETLGDRTNVYSSAVHSSTWGSKVTSAEVVAVPDVADAFRTYGMLWTPEAITFTFDGRVVNKVATPETLHGPMSLHLNLAIGGWAGPTDATTPDGASFEVDYVRVYQIPGVSELPRSTVTADFGDEENGVLFTGANKVVDLYGDVVRRAVLEAEPDLALAPGEVATLVGDGRDNRLVGNDEGNVLNGADGADILTGAGGDDYLIGGAGDDVLDGGTGDDTLAGGAGDDLYILRRGDGGERGQELILEQAGEGFDTIYFADLLPRDVASYIDWARWQVVVNGPGGQEYFSVKVTPGVGGHHLDNHIERIVFADGTVWETGDGVLLSGDAEDNRNSGTRWNDTVLGGAGADTVIGMDGDDVIDGGAGADLALGWNGNDVISDSGRGDVDTLRGEAGDDTLTGGTGGDVLSGGSGNDVLRGGTDASRLDGDGGDDLLIAKNGADTLSGGGGNDDLRAGGGDDAVDGGNGDDTVNAGSGDDTVFGDDGRDRIGGGDGDDALFGGAGADTLSGGNGADTLDGGAGVDRYEGGAGIDLFRLAFSQMDGDTIIGFSAGERIEVGVDGDVADAAVSVSGTRITVHYDGATASFVAKGVGVGDVVIVALDPLEGFAGGGW